MSKGFAKKERRLAKDFLSENLSTLTHANAESEFHADWLLERICYVKWWYKKQLRHRKKTRQRLEENEKKIEAQREVYRRKKRMKNDPLNRSYDLGLGPVHVDIPMDKGKTVKTQTNPNALVDEDTGKPLPVFVEGSNTEIEEWFRGDWDTHLAQLVATQISRYLEVVQIPDTATSIRFCIRDWPYRHHKRDLYRNFINESLNALETNWVLEDVEYRHFKEPGEHPEWVFIAQLRPKGLSDLVEGQGRYGELGWDAPEIDVSKHGVFGRTDKPKVRALHKFGEKSREKSEQLSRMKEHAKKKKAKRKKRK